MNARSTLLQWLSKSELQRTLDGLDLLCCHHADPQRSAEVALLSGRHHHLLEQQRDCTIHQADYLTERARISKAVMDVVQHLPADWSAEPLAQVPPAAEPLAATPAATPPPKSFLEKWGLIIGIVAGIAGITGLTLKDVLFPKKTEPAATQQTAGATQAPSTSQPAGQVREKKAEQADDNQPKKSPSTSSSSRPSVSTPQQTTVVRPSDTEAEKAQPAPTQPAATGKFRSYAPTKIIEGMERGKVDGEHAYRNLMTNKILCCYDDAEDFSGGKAWVSRRGKYFYINKSGEEVEE